jgi:hypothetical protein
MSAPVSPRVVAMIFMIQKVTATIGSLLIPAFRTVRAERCPEVYDVYLKLPCAG